MAERAKVFEKPRFGLEDAAAPGAPVGATKVLQSLTVEPSPMFPRNAVKAAGRKRPVGVTSEKHWTDLNISGSACYYDTAYMLNGALCVATATQLVAGVTRLSWMPSGDASDIMATYSLEMGSSAGTARVPGVTVTDLAFAFSKKEAKLTGKAVGKRYDEGIALTASPVDVPLIPCAPNRVSIYAASTLALLTDAASRLKRCVSAQWGQAGKQSALFTLDDTEGSFSTTLEKEYEQNAQIVVMQDSQGQAIMNRMRGEEIFFTRYEVLGKDITAGNPFRLRITFPSYVSKTGRGETEDMFAGTYDLEPVELTDAFGAGKTGSVLIEMDVPTTFATALVTVGTAVAGYQSTVVAGNAAN